MGRKVYMLVTEGIGVGDAVAWGSDIEVKNGNTLPLSGIPTGAYICNIEAKPNDGGKFVRASGVQAIVVDKTEDKVGVQMPSGKTKWFNSRCRATVGIVAGGGRGEKPFVKAGNKYHKMANTASNWPRVRGVAMNVIDHPFGGGGHQHPGRPKTVARGTSPGKDCRTCSGKADRPREEVRGRSWQRRLRRDYRGGVRSSPIMVSGLRNSRQWESASSSP